MIKDNPIPVQFSSEQKKLAEIIAGDITKACEDIFNKLFNKLVVDFEKLAGSPLLKESRGDFIDKKKPHLIKRQQFPLSSFS